MVTRFRGVYDLYLSYIPIEQLDDGYTTKCRLGMIFVTWFIVKLDCYLTLYIACHILCCNHDVFQW